MSMLRLRRSLPTAVRGIRLGVETARSALVDPYRPRAFARSLRSIQRVAPRELPDAGMLEVARSAWGNRKWSAESDYLVEVAQRAQAADGPIVECGSGLTTFLLALYAPPGVSVWALESNRYFYEQVRRVLAREGLANVSLVYSPLQDYGDYEWYGVPTELPNKIGVVVCDGPPGSGKGGRYGAMPILAQRLSESFVFLLDDVGSESAAVARWESEFGTATERRPGERSQYAVVRPAGH